MHSEELSEPYFSGKKIEILSDILEVKNLYTMFDFYIVEVFKELFNELRGESPMRLLQPKASMGLFSPTYHRTVASRKSVSNSLEKAYNWLTEMNLLPSNLRELSLFQVKKLISEISSIYVVDNRELFSMYFFRRSIQ